MFDLFIFEQKPYKSQAPSRPVLTEGAVYERNGSMKPKIIEKTSLSVSLRLGQLTWYETT